MARCVAYSPFWTPCNPDRIDALFRQSGLYRSKWERADYRVRTITRAIAHTTDIYEPPIDIPDQPLEQDTSAVAWDLESPGESL